MITRVLLSIGLLVLGFASGFYFGHKSSEGALQVRGPNPGERPSAFEEKSRTVPPANTTTPAPPPSPAVTSPIPAAESERNETLIQKPNISTIGLPIRDVKRSDILDTFDQARGTDRKHEATDIMAPRGTPVLAVVDGIIRKLFNSKPGGLTIYLFDNGEKHAYYYAHLDRYAENLREGQVVKRGDVIAYVGSTGNARPDAPHLHFAIFELGPEKEWWRGSPINPYPLLVEAFEARH